jgi:hypothetical protein
MGSALALSLGLALTASITGVVVTQWSDDVGISHTVAIRLMCALGILAAIAVTLGVSVALLVRAHAEKNPGVAAQVGLAPGRSLEQQAIQSELSIEQYQRVALDQARVSFAQSQRAMFLALLVLIAGSAAVVFVADRRGQLIVGAFTVLGSGFSAFLSKTFLDVFRESIDQLNRSHSIPITKNLILLANALITNEKIPVGREKAVRNVVTALLRAITALSLELMSLSREQGTRSASPLKSWSVSRDGTAADGS